MEEKKSERRWIRCDKSDGVSVGECGGSEGGELGLTGMVWVTGRVERGGEGGGDVAWVVDKQSGGGRLCWRRRWRRPVQSAW